MGRRAAARARLQRGNNSAAKESTGNSAAQHHYSCIAALQLVVLQQRAPVYQESKDHAGAFFAFFAAGCCWCCCMASAAAPAPAPAAAAAALAGAACRYRPTPGAPSPPPLAPDAGLDHHCKDSREGCDGTLVLCSHVSVQGRREPPTTTLKPYADAQHTAPEVRRSPIAGIACLLRLAPDRHPQCPLQMHSAPPLTCPKESSLAYPCSSFSACVGWGGSRLDWGGQTCETPPPQYASCRIRCPCPVRASCAPHPALLPLGLPPAASPPQLPASCTQPASARLPTCFRLASSAAASSSSSSR